MERCGRCGVEVGDVPEVVWWCWWCGRALCNSCGGSDTATCGVVPRTCDRHPRRMSARSAANIHHNHRTLRGDCAVPSRASADHKVYCSEKVRPTLLAPMVVPCRP